MSSYLRMRIKEKERILHAIYRAVQAFSLKNENLCGKLNVSCSNYHYFLLEYLWLMHIFGKKVKRCLIEPKFSFRDVRFK